jgi:ABC-2 type transport system ATP-binding protein
MSSVEVKDLSVRAGSKVLVSKVTLSIDPGTWCTIIGPNGAGKTTLVETIAGLRRASHGTVSILGQEIAANESERCASHWSRSTRSCPVA